MYNITRQDASEILGVSTRSIDRYIRAGKLRSKKDGKIIYINKLDLENINKNNTKKQEVIIPNNSKIESKEISSNINEVNFIYNDLKETIKEKDRKIEELSIKLGKAEEIVKNSISMIEFKKSQYLLEQKEESLEKDLQLAKEENDKKEKIINENKSITTTLIIFSFILLISLIIVWFIRI